MKPIAPHLVVTIVLLLMLLDILSTVASIDYPPRVFEFPFKRYGYKKKQKSEKRIKSLKIQCEHTDECKDLRGVALTACVRKCMSPVCYNDLYALDELEEGEVDVRFNSFKGCIIEKQWDHVK